MSDKTTPDADEFAAFMKAQNDVRNSRFSIESSIESVIRDYVPEEEDVALMFNAIVTTIQKALTDKSLRKALLAIKMMEIED